MIREVERNANVPVSEMARRLGLAQSSLSGILKNKEKILDQETQCGSKSKQRKNVKKSPYEEMESKLMEWFNGARAENIPIDGALIKMKASTISLKLGLTDFKASNGWLDRFKKRHGITCRAVCGESAAVSDESVEHWKEEVLPSLLEGFESRDIYNVDETGLFYQLMPSKTYSVKGEACHGGKMSKQRITVLLCSNADGSDKLEPIVIGKFQKPRCFKNSVTLPCKYYSNKTAWMTADLFKKFLQAFDARMGTRNRNVVLFMDKCPAHPKDLGFLRNVTVHFFPANCTSRLQPMDLGIIHSLKSKYRKALVLKALAFIDRNEVLKLNILQAMHMLTGAWKMVSKETISNCFHKAGFNEMVTQDNDSDEAGVDLHDWVQVTENVPITFDEFVACDDEAITTCIRDVEEICDDELQQNDDDDIEEDDGVREEEMEAPTFSEAVASIDVVRRFVTAFKVDNSVIDRVNQLEMDILNLKTKTAKKQTTILDYWNLKK